MVVVVFAALLPHIANLFLDIIALVTDVVELGSKKSVPVLAKHGRKLHYLCMLMVGLFLGVCGWALLFEPMPY